MSPRDGNAQAPTFGAGRITVLDAFWRSTPEGVSLAVVVVSTAAFLTLSALDVVHILDWDQALDVLGVSYVGVVKRLWLFQFVTAPFVHASLTHVAFNMLTLSWLGPDIERRLGCLHYLMFSAVCALVSLAGFLWWSLGTGFVGCGYSGVIFGLLVAAATFTPDRTVWIYAFFPLRMRVAVLVLGVVELYFTLVPAQGGHVANVAHLFGGAAGWAYLRWGVGRPRLVRSPIPLAPPAGSPRQRGKGGPGIPWEL